MKNKNLLIATLFIFLSAGLFAQAGNNVPQNKKSGPLMNIPDLTDTQKEQIKEMRTAHMKEMMPLKNELKEKEARLQTLQTSDNPNMGDIYKQIDEIGAIKINMAKKHADFRQKVRKILTADQRIYYDMHAGQKHKKMMMSKKKDCMNK